MTSLRCNPPKVRRIIGIVGVSAALAVAAGLLGPVPAGAADTHEAQLVAREGSADAKLGTAASISGDTAVAGAPDEGGSPEEGGGMGAAYVFTRNGGKWIEGTTLVAPVRTDGDKFGFSVAIDHDTIVVGAPNSDEQVPRPGVAYVFVRRGATWVYQATLTPSVRNTDDAFGYRVAISGDTAVVGANGGSVRPSSEAGAAYVFTRTGNVWTEQARLTAHDGSPGSGFGFAVAVSDDTAVVSAITDVGGAGLAPGAVYVFTRTGSVWAEEAKLAAADGSPGDAFGVSVAISRDTVVVGSVQDQVGLNPVQGSAYVFVRNGRSWAQQAKLTAPAPNGDAGDMFGRSVATNGDVVAVGAHFDEEGGGVYIFNRVKRGWSAPTRHTATGASLLGVSIGVSGDTVIAGANFTQVGDNGAQGGAYIYRLGPAAARS